MKKLAIPLFCLFVVGAAGLTFVGCDDKKDDKEEEKTEAEIEAIAQQAGQQAAQNYLNSQQGK